MKRIEEDRERHKRLKEDVWLVQHHNQPQDVDVEFEKAWETPSMQSFSALDWEIIQSEMQSYYDALAAL